MAYNQLKNAVNANIKRNGVQAITGNLLNAILNNLISNLGDGYQFKGMVTPESEVSVGDKKVFLFAKVAGTYPNCGGLVAESNELTTFLFDGENWSKDSIVVGGVTKQYVDNLVLMETQRAQVADERLRGNIQEEMDRAMQAESDLSNNILAEQTRAENAESDLSHRIDAIVQGRDVRDIVGTYAELLAYDTSTLGDNDIIMVLLDNTKSDHTTYYRWHTDTQSWEFIGGLAFTYTKTEIDEKFRALHIVLPSIPAEAVEHPEEYQELLAQVDSMVRSAGSDASFKMPVLVVDGISGNVDVTFVKSNPAHLFLGIFADDMSTLYHIIRTTSTPRTYTLQIVLKVFVNEEQAIHLANDAITDALDEEAYGAIIEAIKNHHDDTKADKSYVDDRHVVITPIIGEDDVIVNAEEIYNQLINSPADSSIYVRILEEDGDYTILPATMKEMRNDEGEHRINININTATTYFYFDFTFKDGVYEGVAGYDYLASKSELTELQSKVGKLEIAIVKDLESTTKTIVAVAKTNYIFGVLESLAVTFPASGNDGEMIDILCKSGETAMTLVVDGNWKGENFAPSANSVVEINAVWYAVEGKWMVLFNEIAL